MKILLKQIIFLSSLCLFYSCATKSNIFDGTKFSLAKNDKLYLLDSFEVVQVIDNRNPPDSIIGDANYEYRPLILNRPLKDFLKMSLNTLMKSDTSQSAKIPVTVYIDEFYSGRNSGFFYHCAYFKYSYLFEYPYNNKINRFRILDSAILCNDPQLYEQRNLIRKGIRDAARFFQDNYLKNYPQDTTQYNTILAEDKSQESKQVIDTVDLYKIQGLGRKSGGMVNYYRGSIIDFGVQFAYIRYYSRPNTQSEVGVGIAVELAEFRTNEYEGNLFSYSFPAFYRYNFSPQKNDLFVELSFSVASLNESDNKLTIGAKIKESIGYYISDYFSLTLGLFQEGFINSKLIPLHYGMLLSLNITNTYF